VRVPLGYWNVLGAVAGVPYVPSSPGKSLAVLDRLFEWADAHGLKVLLDLHGAPGSQNGADHSGCDEHGIQWGAGKFFELSLRTISVLANIYGPHQAFLGIELMNEPAWVLEWNHDLLLNYYTRAHALVRAVSSEALVVFNILYLDDFPAGFANWWSGQMVGHNVAVDLHLYDCFGHASGKTVIEHIAQAAVWHDRINYLQTQGGHKILVGEWSLAAGIHSAGQIWASAQVEAFSAGIGWFFWSLKKEGFSRDDRGGDTWSLQGVYQSGITFNNTVPTALLPSRVVQDNSIATLLRSGLPGAWSDALSKFVAGSLLFLAIAVAAVLRSRLRGGGLVCANTYGQSNSAQYGAARGQPEEDRYYIRQVHYFR